MSRLRLPLFALRALLLAPLAGSGYLSAQDDGAIPDNSSGQSPREEAFREAISGIESGQSAYAPALIEQLLSLGLALQHEGRHTEAVDVFKRGVHLSRINHGLYSAEQLPLLQGEIASQILQGQYAEADERQVYMYRVQIRTLNSGLSRARALMQQAGWQYRAYRLDLSEHGFPRLMYMWDLYRLALNDIIAQEGEASAALLPALRGMLRAQYLISGYQSENSGSGDSFGEDIRGSQALTRFNAYRAQSYEKGRAVIQAIYDIEQQQSAERSLAAAETLVSMGDWMLWHGAREAAAEAYGDAYAELAALDDAETQVERILGEPAALPDIEGIRPLPAAVSAEQGDVLLQFGVTPRGRVTDLERLDENEDHDGVANRLMRKLRRTKFRPRIEAGEPVETENFVRAYVLND